MDDVRETGWEAIEPVAGEALDEEQIEALLAQLPELGEEDADEVAFRRREDSMKPPLSGDDVEGTWPPDHSAPQVQPSPSGPVQVQAFRPSGQASPPFQVALVFDRPMVSLGAVGSQETDAFSISPSLEGRWRWLGTQTIVFEPADAWSMATEFEVSVDASLRAVDGSELSEAAGFEFRTPPPEVSAVYPGRHGLYAQDKPVIVAFNQAIDAESADAISVREGRQEVPMRLLDAEELAAEAERWNLDEALAQNRLIGLAPRRPYSYDSQVSVAVEGPLLSAEGPVLGQGEYRSHFRIHGAFEFEAMECGWGDQCRPGHNFTLRMTTGIAERDEPIDVVVEPAVDDLVVAHSGGNALTLRGDFKPRTTYEVTVPADLEDIYGQTIEGERTRSMDVGSYAPFVAGPSQPLVVRPAEQATALPIRLAELEQLRVRIYAVGPDDWPDFVAAQSQREEFLPGSPAVEETLRFSGDERHQPQTVALDYGAALSDGGTGHALVVVDEPQPWQGHGEPRWTFWVQHSDLGADITSDSYALATAITKLSTGEPVVDAALSMGDEELARTDDAGEAALSLARISPRNRALVVREGQDSLIIPAGGEAQWPTTSNQWQHPSQSSRLLWYIVDDRQTYKPGETVTLRGWVRTLKHDPESDLGGVGAGIEIDYGVREPRHNEIAEGTVETDQFGGFEFRFEVPDSANLGTAQVHLTAPSLDVDAQNRATVHTIDFQEFRRPEYEVTLDADEGPHQVGESTRFSVHADYYAGGAVSAAPVSWRFEEQAASFEPAGWSGWTFGRWTPWWSPFGRGGQDGQWQVLNTDLQSLEERQTGADGTDTVETTFETPDRGFVRQVTATASVTDVNRQSWEASDEVLVHPGDYYVGLRAEKNFVPRQQPWAVDAVVVDHEGQQVAGPEVSLQLQKQRNWQEYDDVEVCAKSAGDEPVSCEFSDLAPGSYRVVASVEDDQGRRAETETNFWVAGRDTSGAETAEEDTLVLIPEQEEFAVGDRADILVQSPYYPLDAIVELRRDGRYERRRVALSADDPVVSIDIEESMIPNVHVKILALGGGDDYEADQFGAGSIELAIDRGPRTLNVDIQPESETIVPGDDLSLTTAVTDTEGEPVEGAQVLVYAVDESVLALSNYALADPVDAFYPKRSTGMSDIRSRSWMVLDAPTRDDEEGSAAMDQMGRGSGAIGSTQSRSVSSGAPSIELAAGTADAEGFGGVQGSEEAPAMALREVFDALAFFRSDGITDADGKVTLSETMPDSLTRYRLMAVAVDGPRHFGSATDEVTARRPLMVRPSAPRFLNVGDRFELPVVVHNRSDQDRTVAVALRATSALEWLETPGRAIRVPADDRVEIRFPAEVTAAGTTRIQVGITDDEYADAELITLPVLTPATTEAFATYGSIGNDDADAVLQHLQVPEAAYAQFGGLEVTTSSTQLQALTDAFIYLTSYPFECSEQLASRVLSVLALADVLAAFEADGLPDEEDLEASMDGWIADLEELQRGDGGFGFWSGSTTSSPYASAHATMALWQAQQAGYDVDDYVLRRAQQFLTRLPQMVENYHKRAAAAVSAYGLHVRHAMDQANRADLDALVTRHGIEDMPLEALGWLLPMAEGTQFETRFLQRLTNQAQQTASTAEFQESYDADAHRILHTTRRTDGVVLAGLIAVDPDHDLIEKVARGLLAHRSRGRWQNTQENVFILTALRAYFDAYEDVEPDFVARAWLGEEQIAEHSFVGRTTERAHQQVPMSYLVDQSEGEDDALPVVLQRDGQGRMYYRLGMRYAPTSRMLPAHDEGFVVERSYEAVDDDDDVERTDQGWRVRAGARVRVNLTMTVPARRYHVALVDWLPAGFEAVNTALATSDVEDDLVGGSQDRRRYMGWWGRPWFEHQNMRDERVEAFSSMVAEGIHSYSYVVRATTPGEFIAMPAKAEEMYHPETFGRSGSEVVEVVGGG